MPYKIKTLILRLLREELEQFKLPLISLTKVFHVGSLDMNKKSDFSLEGSGLSISVNPDEWSKIARLGGELHTLVKTNGVFVNAYKLNKSQKQNIIKWGLENGLVNQKETYQVCWYDDEMEDDVCMEFNNIDDAKSEAGNEDEGRTIKIKKSGLLPTNKLNSQTKQTKIEPSQTFDLLLSVYVDETTDYDGIWWSDTLDISKYSAPRGVIFNDKVNTWKVTK